MPRLEAIERLCSGVLALVAVNRFGLHTTAAKLLDHTVSTVFGAGEDEAAAHFGLVEHSL